MKILVTGGTGNVGRGVVARLVNRGHEVRAVDLRVAPENRLPGATYAECDITRFDDLREQVRGMEGIVHLAAYAAPSLASGPEIYRVNCWGTYNVYEAAAQEGIRRVTSASSINALGFNFGIKSFPIEYFPIDEAHPTFTTDPYSFSKQTIESIAEYYWRRDGISGTSLRMPFVFAYDERVPWMKELKEMMGAYPRIVQELLSAPAEKQRSWLDGIFARLAEARQTRANEKPWTGEPPPEDFDLSQLAGFGYTDFWAIIAVEDAAQAFEKSLLAEYEGSHPLFISQRDNNTGLESEALLKLFFPTVTARKKPIVGASTLVSYDLATALIDYVPHHAVGDFLV
jgi:nucleoside-diphosphate-sugar epimerase